MTIIISLLPIIYNILYTWQQPYSYHRMIHWEDVKVKIAKGRPFWQFIKIFMCGDHEYKLTTYPLTKNTLLEGGLYCTDVHQTQNLMLTTHHLFVDRFFMSFCSSDMYNVIGCRRFIVIICFVFQQLYFKLVKCCWSCGRVTDVVKIWTNNVRCYLKTLLKLSSNTHLRSRRS